MRFGKGIGCSELRLHEALVLLGIGCDILLLSNELENDRTGGVVKSCRRERRKAARRRGRDMIWWY